MRNVLRSVFVVAIVSTVTAGLVAQTPSSSAPQSGKQVTFSGCIERAPSASGGSASATASPSGTSASASATPAFILTNVSPAASGGTVGTAGSTTAGSTTASSTKTATKYRLDADASKLTPHVGHKVEVTGTIDEQSSSASSPSTTASSPSSSAASSAAGMEPKFKVESVKMVAASCS
jgi:hypothetical protein